VNTLGLGHRVKLNSPERTSFPVRQGIYNIRPRLWLRGRHICILSDSVALLLSLGISYWALLHLQARLHRMALSLFQPFELWPLMLLLAPIWLLTFAGMRYLRARRASISKVRRTVSLQFGLFGTAAVFLSMNSAPTSTCLAVLSGIALCFPLSILGRCVLVFLVESCHSPFAVPLVLIVGTRDGARDVVAQLRNADCNCRIIGCLDPDPSLAHGSLEGVPILGTTAVLRDFVFRNPVDMVIFASPFNAVPEAVGLATSVLELGLQVGFHSEDYLPDPLRTFGGEVSFGLFPGVPIVTLSTVSFRPIYSLLKRLLDIVVSVLALLVLSPLMLVIALLIKVISPNGPVLHRLDHVGINGRRIIGYKFRTMVPNAHSLKPQLMSRNKMTGPVFKIQDDPRIIPLGRWLRRYSLDELPQLYSVLKGELSLVGPRAPMREEAERFEYWQRRKLCVKPGLTCFWQVNGRSEISDFSEWVRLDLDYVRQASFLTDLKILLRTVPVVLQGRGAY